MALYILKRFNWVDVFVLIILFRISYIAIKNGLSIELFKFLGALFAVYLSLHYYTVLADFVGNRLNLKNTFREFLYPSTCITFAILGYSVFALLRKIFARFIMMEAIPSLNKWGGFFLGIARFILSISLVMYFFIISPFGYLKHSTNNSFSSRYLLKVAPATYSSLWIGIISKFMTQEKFNQDVFRIKTSTEVKK
jgi:uncharacterized membrane protein required for colicin V production